MLTPYDQVCLIVNKEPLSVYQIEMLLASKFETHFPTKLIQSLKKKLIAQDVSKWPMSHKSTWLDLQLEIEIELIKRSWQGVN
jgi:hypothetical protein